MVVWGGVVVSGRGQRGGSALTVLANRCLEQRGKPMRCSAKGKCVAAPDGAECHADDTMKTSRDESTADENVLCLFII